ncbi:unnamed protein product [Rotaria sp. Silwood1]|nr:unnamed protein product [Rotaria sp. Silwood1]CAF0740331.1 unnamed protein product [Rotaria sp. Silwood1]CAF3333511.1 unnamed protein product [Rotaria sp. Silwood1]CAF3359290.1 unnamed protein product [Rotaria sp. Silwood1]CAF4577748.1 unnamed protein product [Rotaria sp. Silwood1]
MVIIELIGSISLAIALVSAVAFVIIHIKNKQHDVTFIHDDTLNNIEQSDIITKHLQEDINQSSLILPFEEFNQDIAVNSSSKTNSSKELSIINVINNGEISPFSIKYGIQWTLPLNQDIQPGVIKSSSYIVKTSEFDQGDSLSFNDQTVNVRHLIEKFENNSIRKTYGKEKNNQSEPDLTSIDTNIDSQTVKIDFNQNQQKLSYHSSLSNLDVTMPTNLSSSIDLEQFECFSTTSNLSEFLNNN